MFFCGGRKGYGGWREEVSCELPHGSFNNRGGGGEVKGFLIKQLKPKY